jgi:Glycosyl transferase family 2
MKISAFSFVKNAVKYGYPVTESINSILPIVDEFVICLGDSEDSTNELITSIHSDKIKIIQSVWDNSLREGGKVLAVETDKALAATAADSDWLFYIQADEVVHEKYLPTIVAAMKQYKDDKTVEGLLFHYTHFYGSYRYVGDGRAWYTNEIRIIRNDKNIHSYRDAQGFRFSDNRKLKVKQIDAYIYHYGWVKDPLVMHRKIMNSTGLYDPKHVQQPGDTKFDYSKVDSVTEFEGTHPAVMQQLIRKADWDFETDSKRKNFKSIKHKLLYFIWQYSGWRPFEYRNYKKI